MKKLFIFLVAIALAAGIYFSYKSLQKSKSGLQSAPIQKPLLVYTFDTLRKTEFPRNQIRLDRPYSETAASTAQIFYFNTPKRPGEKEMDRISGVVNIPKKPGKYPIIVLLRGYVPEDIYKPGVGTQHVGETLAAHGYITLSPDFLGFGESSPAAKDTFEARFQTYTTALTLLSSLSTLNEELSASYSGTITADLSRIGMWGHSNGGHIALSVLAISGKKYPTVLWAPVSKSFPYSILYYSDDVPDHGKALRAVLANFERDYNADLFSPLNYYSQIKASLSIHQGVNDEAVPQQWSQDLVSILKKSKVDVSYQTYQGDHNMLPSAWSEAVRNSVTFFDKQFEL